MAEQQLKVRSTNRIGDPITHFVSLEVKCDGDHRNFCDQVAEFQHNTLKMFPEHEGKAAKLDTLHITLATLNVRAGEEIFVKQAITDAVDQFKQTYSEQNGIRVNFQGISTFKDVIYLEMALGANSFTTFKDILMYRGLYRYVTDEWQDPHLTYIRKMELNETEKNTLMTMMDDIQTEKITLDNLSLREKKQAGGQVKPPLREWCLWKENME